MENQVTIEPVVKTIEVDLAVEAAFALFTDRIGAWWPKTTHARSVHEHNSAAVDITLEPRVGGRLYETTPEGEHLEWGIVTAYEPARRVAFTWRMGRPEEQASNVEVVFDDLGGDRTRVQLTHAGWERLGADGQKQRDGYDQGWVGVLGEYQKAVTAGT